MKSLVLTVQSGADGQLELRAPTVGRVRELPPVGSVVVPGQRVGALDALGVVRPLIVPPNASGRVVERHGDPATRAAVAYGTVLLRIEEGAGAAASDAPASGAAARLDDALVFRAPMSGRFYARPAPDKPALVDVGDVISTGQAVCLLEVMKTFNRIAFGGPGLPERVRVARWTVADGADVTGGEPLFVFEVA